MIGHYARDRESTEPYWVNGLAGALSTGGPVWHYFYTHHYPLHAEALVLPIGAALLGALVALTARRFQGLIATFLFALLLFVFVDLQFDLLAYVPMWLVAAGLLCLAQLFWRRRALLICITLGAFYVATLPRGDTNARIGKTGTGDAVSRPMLVHVILDEQWGPGGVRAAGDSATARFMEEFYSRHGFEVYSGAYSRWRLTRFSIPSILALGQPFAVDSSVPNQPEWTDRRMRPRSNPYFGLLRLRGYQVMVYESSYMDYCDTPGVEVAWCDKAPSNSIANIAHLRGSWLQRAQLCMRFFLNATSTVYRRLQPDSEVWRRSVIGGAFAQFERLIDDVRTADVVRGAAYFVHVLMPHNPLEVDAQCRVYPDVSHRVAYGRNREPLTDSLWRARVAMYGEQTRCVHRYMARLLTVIDSTAGRDHSIVVVHGDHGSRMLQSGLASMPLSQMSPAQLNAIFSTLLAVRRPTGRPGVNRRAVPLQDFMWQLITSDFGSDSLAAWEHFVRASTGLDSLRRLEPADMVWADSEP